MSLTDNRGGFLYCSGSFDIHVGGKGLKYLQWCELIDKKCIQNR